MKIVVVEDNVDHQELIEENLHKIFEDVEVTCLSQLDQVIDCLAEKDYDIVLMDLVLPDSTLENTMQWVAQGNLEMPIVVLTSLDDPDLGAELVRAGVQDYLPKSDLHSGLLRRVCLHAIERKEQKLALESQVENMRTFCRILSHDFNGALGRISSLVEMLSKSMAARGEIPQPDQKYIDYIIRSAASVRALTKGLVNSLSVDGSQANHEVIDLNETIEIANNLTKQQTKKKYTFTVGQLPMVQGDKHQLIMLFQNLIGNGIKYNTRKPEIKISATTDGVTGQCEVSIADNGIGMEQAAAEKIFEPFVRLAGAESFSGSGLGLSIVKRIIDNHEGTVTVLSQPGEGSTFNITLPLANETNE